MAFDYDLLVIGAGSGGVRASRMAAAQGVRVAVVEEKYFGGTCVNVGCVPKKLFVYASEYSQHMEEAKGYGWDIAASTHDWPTLIANKNAEIERLNGIYQRLLDNAGVSIIRGRARFVDGHTVEVDGKRISAEKILIGVGGKPSKPNFKGGEYSFDSNQAFYLEKRPASVAIVGGSYIALEFGGIFRGLGSEVHVLARSQVLRGYDSTVAEFARQEISKKGVQLYDNTEITEIIKEGDNFRCKLNTGESLVVEAVMYAAGRDPLTDDLGLENTQVKRRDNGTIIVNDNFQSDEPSVYALGDVIGTPELTPVALAQAMVFVDQQYGTGTRKMSYDAIASAMFCQPNIAFVGLSEEEAKEQGLACDVYLSEFKSLKHTLSGSSERTLIKMLVRSADQRVMGVHIVGAEAGEIIQGFAVAVKAGLAKTDLDATIGIHPTMAEELVTLRDIKYRIN